MTKDKAMTFRFRTGIREMLQELAEADRRNVTNYLEVLIEKQHDRLKTYVVEADMTEEESRAWNDKFLNGARAALAERGLL
jgi:hypothetical protein